MHLCRNLFPTLLETEGKLLEILKESFGSNCFDLYEVLTENKLEDRFKEFIYNKVDMETPDKKLLEKKTPYELLDEAGYDLFECRSEEEIQSYKHYYAPGEELCTFNGGRLNRCFVFWAVRKDVDEIKREDYVLPKREDKYGTSVMGIQFNKTGTCTVSIKNRYNHRVNNPDATYGNDLDRIIPGLTQSFSDLLEKRGLNLNNSNREVFSIPGYVVAWDGKFYKYNMELGGDYYCPGNIVIEHGEVKHLPNHQMLIDYFVVDLEKKSIELYDKMMKDSFVDGFNTCEKIEIEKDKEKGIKRIIVKNHDSQAPIVIEVNESNEIVGYEHSELETIGDNCLCWNLRMKHLELPRLKKVGRNFLGFNVELNYLELPNLEEVDGYFLNVNKVVSQLKLPKLKRVGASFLRNNRLLKQIDLPELEEVGDSFCSENDMLMYLNLPVLKRVGNDFFNKNNMVMQLDLPQLRQVGNGFFRRNRRMNELSLSQLETVGASFLYRNVGLKEINLPRLRQVGNNFLSENCRINSVNLPQLETIDDYFLTCAEELRELKLPKLKSVGRGFLSEDKKLSYLELPKVKSIGSEFLEANEGLKQLELPKLKSIGDFFLEQNTNLTELKVPKLDIEKYYSVLSMHCQKLIISQKTQQVITAQSIATLDKEAGLTTSEVDFAAGHLERDSIQNNFEEDRGR